MQLNFFAKMAESIKIGLLAVICALSTVYGEAALVWDSDAPPTVTQNTEIVISGWPNGTLNVPNGVTVTITGRGVGSNLFSSGNRITINTNTNGRVVWKAHSIALITMLGSGTFELRDGIVQQITASASGSTVLVSGGMVFYRYSDFYAINAAGALNISGGAVISAGDGIIGRLNFSDGAISSSVTNVINKAPTSQTGGVIIANINWISSSLYSRLFPDKVRSSLGPYAVGSKTALLTMPENADVYWDLEEGVIGIRHGDKFFPLIDSYTDNNDIVVVKTGRKIWDDWAPNILNGDEIEIRAGARGTLLLPNETVETVTIISDGEVTNFHPIGIEFGGTGGNVIWKADYQSSVTGGANNAAVSVSGPGNLNIAQGRISSIARVYESHLGYANIDYIPSAVGLEMRDAGRRPGNITVSGGAITSLKNVVPINLRGWGNLSISGGTVSTINEFAIAIGGADRNVNNGYMGTINISGGLLVSQGPAVRIVLDNGTNPWLSELNSTGGLVIDYPSAGTFMHGSKTGLHTLPQNAEVSWALQEGVSGIKYDGDKFFAVTGSDVSVLSSNDFVLPALVWDRNVPPGFSDGDKIEIRAGASGILIVPNDVTVTIVSDGEVRNANRLSINTNTSGRVIWKANYISSAPSSALEVYGSGGSLEIVAGQIISVADGNAISASNRITITVTGGLVSSKSAAIHGDGNGQVVVNINGGAVESINEQSAVIQAQTVNINGGVIINTLSHRAIGATAVRMTGGLIAVRSSQDSFTEAVTNPVSQTGGAIVGISPAASDIKIGTRRSLVSIPQNADVSWEIEDGVMGVAFGELFAAINKFSLRRIWNSDRAPIVEDGDEIEIRAGAGGILNVPDDVTVTIVSDGPVLNTKTLTINAGTNTHIVWKADYRTSTTSEAISYYGPGFEVRQGRISKTRGGEGIASHGGNIIVSGGVVSTNSATAIRGFFVRIRGGLVIAETRATALRSTMRSMSIVDNSPVIVTHWNTNFEQTGGVIVGYVSAQNVAVESKSGLRSLPEDASISWAIQDGATGIRYDGDKFFALKESEESVSIRNQSSRAAGFGILLENAIVSDSAKISVITPEPATVNLRIIDNLGNLVFTETVVYGQVSNLPLPTIIWDLTNSAGRYVGNGTYLVLVQAQGQSGRTYVYSAKIGVNR